MGDALCLAVSFFFARERRRGRSRRNRIRSPSNDIYDLKEYLREQSMLVLCVRACMSVCA